MRRSAPFVIAMVLAGCGGGDASKPGGAPAAGTEDKFGAAVFLSIACREYRTVDCDELIVSVQSLPRATESLRASVAGQPVAMKQLGESRRWEGKLHPAGLTADGPLHVETNSEGKVPLDTNVTVPVDLRADFSDGSTRFRTKDVEIGGDYG